MRDLLLIKVGGGKTINWDYIAEDLISYIKKYRIILVHGASQWRDEIAKQLGHPTKTLISPSGIESVYTDKKALDILLMVYSGLVNKTIVSILQKHHINAVGLSGVDGKLWEGKRKHVVYAKINSKVKLIADSYTGKVEKINTKLINLLIDNQFIPVICAPAITYDNEIINMDNDAASAVMASSLHIKKMIILFEASGLLQNVNDEKSLIKKINKKEIDSVMEFAKGRMKKKLLGTKYALENGVEIICYGDGRIKNPIKNALDGGGTILS